VSPPRNLAARALLGLPAMAYGEAMRLRNRFYDGKGAVHRAGLPVLSVGNLTVGGTGKTPIVAWLVRTLRECGLKPAVVSRGYGGTAGRGPLLVSRGDGPLAGARICGDEPYLLARHLEGAIVIVGSDRVEGTRAARRAGADVAVLDDGFQHRRLARDLDIVLLDAHNPFGNYSLLPAGTLREPLAGLARAGIVLITRSRPGESLVVIERVVRRHNPAVPILRAGNWRVGFRDLAGDPVEKPRRALAFCGIGNPASFAADLEAEGVEVVALRIFADHYPYTEADAAALSRLALDRDATLVTTEKDLVRFPAHPGPGPGPAIAALRIEARIHDRDEMLRRIRAAIEGAAP